MIRDEKQMELARVRWLVQGIVDSDTTASMTAVLRIEQYLVDILNGRTSTLTPVTRIEKYLAKISGMSVDIPTPVTRIEKYLFKVAGGDVEVPTPVTPAEQGLAEWAEAGGGAKATVTGTLPLTLAKALSHAIVSLTRYGLCTQEGTPTPDAPVDIMCNNGALKWDSVNQRVYADGTPEVLTVSENLYDESRRTDGYYISSGGAQTKSDGSSFSGAIPATIGKKYTFVGISGKEGSNNKRIVAYKSTSVNSSNKVGTVVSVSVEGIGVPYSMTIDLSDAQYANAKYIRLSFNTDDTNVACFEQGSGQTASVQMLLSVGDVKDEVELIAGTYTHRCAACEYDGTQDVGDTYLSTTGGKDIGAIIVYPLATPTTEHITGQNLATNEGTNVVDSVANASPLEAEVVYMASNS